MRIHQTVLSAVLIVAAAYGQQKAATYAPGQLAVLPGEAVIVSRSGVYPQQIVRPEGPFILYIENKLPGHSEHFSLTLDQSGASEIIGLDTSAGKFNTSNLLDLQPGKYKLRFRGNSTLFVSIEIQPKN